MNGRCGRFKLKRSSISGQAAQQWQASLVGRGPGEQVTRGEKQELVETHVERHALALFQGMKLAGRTHQGGGGEK